MPSVTRPRRPTLPSAVTTVTGMPTTKRIGKQHFRRRAKAEHGQRAAPLGHELLRQTIQRGRAHAAADQQRPRTGGSVSKPLPRPTSRSSSVPGASVLSCAVPAPATL